MGCVKKLLASAELKDSPASTIQFELNTANGPGNELVHLQTSVWRIELSTAEFREFAETICEAGEVLKQTKGSAPEVIS
jgi:hypothetical protein